MPDIVILNILLGIIMHVGLGSANIAKPKNEFFLTAQAVKTGNIGANL